MTLTPKLTSRLWMPVLAGCTSAVLLAGPAAAQDAPPQPEEPVRRLNNGNGNGNDSGSDPAAAEAPQDQPAPTPPNGGNGEEIPVFTGEEELPSGRRVQPSGKVRLHFRDVPPEKLIPFIVETTGKIVIPVQMNLLAQNKITLISEQPVDRMQALDLVFDALKRNGVGIIEKEDVIIIDQLANVQRTDPPIIPADVDVAGRQDTGTIVIKFFKLENASVEPIGELLQENLPDYATLIMDPNSNQIVLFGDIALAKNIEKMVHLLDQDNIEDDTVTYHLEYADANEVADNILDLFEDTGTTTGGGRPRGRGRQAGRQAGGATVATDGTPGPPVELRVTVNVHTNSVTVKASRRIVERITNLVENHWDLPRPAETSKVYHLEYLDPIKVRDLLNNLLSGSAGAGVGGGGRGGGGVRGAGGSGGATVTDVVGGIYNIEAFPPTNSVVVFSKTEESISFIDQFISQLDQPTDIGLPVVVELAHANAIELAQELNVLLQQSGANIGLDAPETGLSGIDVASAAEGGAGAAGAAGGGRGGGGAGGGRAGVLEFPWQRGALPEDQVEPSPLIGTSRIVPIARQNAVAVVAPPQYQQSLVDIIRILDMPSRQVMLSAVIVEVELTDDLAFGVRLSSDDAIFGDSPPDFKLGGTASITGSEEDPFDNIFDTSVLDANLDVNLVIQALARETDVRVLQEPRVFTADNQEAVFFDGQNIPLIANTQITDEGTINEQVQREDVGVILNVRPRITADHDVDLEIYLELSSIAPGSVGAGDFIIDKRFTETEIIVENGQTIVLSGILRDLESRVERKVPLLGDIPIIGELFKSRDYENVRTELIAFITPTVVGNPSENDVNFNELERERLRDLTRPLREQEKRGLLPPIRDRLTPLSQPAAPPPPPPAGEEPDHAPTVHELVDPDA